MSKYSFIVDLDKDADVIGQLQFAVSHMEKSKLFNPNNIYASCSSSSFDKLLKHPSITKLYQYYWNGDDKITIPDDRLQEGMKSRYISITGIEIYEDATTEDDVFKFSIKQDS